MTPLLHRLLASDAPAAVLLIRLLVSAVFVSEGIQKFLFPADLGVVEIIGGLLLLLGLLTRLAAIALIVDMCVAVATTKIPILRTDGVWKMAHEARTDWSMLLGALCLLLVGAGAWSLDALFTRAGTGGRARESWQA